MKPKLTLSAIALLCLSGCATAMDGYFKERIDKGVVFEGGWRRTGIVIKAPGETVSAGSLTIGREVGWGVAAGLPQGEADGMTYEHSERLNAENAIYKTLDEGKTVIRSGKSADVMK